MNCVNCNIECDLFTFENICCHACSNCEIQYIIYNECLNNIHIKHKAVNDTIHINLKVNKIILYINSVGMNSIQYEIYDIKDYSIQNLYNIYLKFIENMEFM